MQDLPGVLYHCLSTFSCLHFSTAQAHVNLKDFIKKNQNEFSQTNWHNFSPKKKKYDNGFQTQSQLQIKKEQSVCISSENKRISNNWLKLQQQKNIN